MRKSSQVASTQVSVGIVVKTKGELTIINHCMLLLFSVTPKIDKCGDS
ncbi:hypothetical protein [Sphaerospermopsis sp. FACHB-1094]|nr:hypothetical protein [Sphaerospermopsis sp. FACHB-1094]